jgi:chaperone required for assembly of F1-ATPase
VAQNSDIWKDLVNTIMKFQSPYKVHIFSQEVAVLKNEICTISYILQ